MDPIFDDHPYEDPRVGITNLLEDEGLQSFRVLGPGDAIRFRVQGLGFRVWGLEYRVWGFRVWGLEFRFGV